jgi:hypothetical protein
MFSENRGRARKKYIEFLDDGIRVKKQEVCAAVDQRVLGEDRLIEQVTEQYGSPVKKERRKREYSLGRIVEAVGAMDRDELRSSGRFRELVRGRAALTVLAKEYGYRGAEIAAFLRRDPTAVTVYGRKRDEAEEFIAAVEKNLGLGRK